MGKGKKLTIYLIDGDDTGPRTIEIGNWSGKAIHSPRASLIELMRHRRDEFSKPGVYILKSDPAGDIYPERVYIGESENIGRRLKEHFQNEDKEFKECIVFISKDELLTRSHIKYIESRLVFLARDAKNSEIENGNTPTESALPEADISDMEEFIRQIQLILPTAGYSFLINNRSKALSSDSEEKKKFFIKNKNYTAEMHIVSNGYLVITGSEANMEVKPSISEGWKKIREQLLSNGTLVENEDKDKYVFKEDYSFSSPSAASSIILGRQSSGPTEWKDEKQRPYKDFETENL